MASSRCGKQANSGSLSDLPAYWRAEAARLRAYGAESQAVTLEACARELEGTYRAANFEVLTLEQASRESGFSYSALEKAVRTGRLSNAGEKGKPRVLRKDLPHKAASGPGEALGLAAQVLARRQRL